MRLLSPYNVEGKWSSAGAGDQGHTRNGNLATQQLLRLGQSSTGIRLDADHEWFTHRWSALTRTGGMIREQPHSHIQDHGHENYRRITSRSIGTPASLLTVTGNTEKIATDIHKNAHWQHMRTIRTRPSNLLGKVQIAAWSWRPPG